MNHFTYVDMVKYSDPTFHLSSELQATKTNLCLALVASGFNLLTQYSDQRA